MMQIVMVRTDTAQCSPAPPGPRATETEADHEDEDKSAKVKSTKHFVMDQMTDIGKHKDIVDRF